MRKVLVVVAGVLVVVLGVLGAAGRGAAAGRARGSGGPVSGGVLRVVSASGPDHLDPVPAYFTADYVLERAYARQLVSYPGLADPTLTSQGWNMDIRPVADVAAQVPTAANGGITDGGTTYTFHLRAGVDWDTSPARPVTAQDFLREFKTFCNPVPGASVGNLGYYTATIRGMTAYCAAEARHFAHVSSPTAQQIAAFANSHPISGITTPNARTIRFRLLAPASDFLHILALPFASARPAEYNQYLPDSAELDQHIISDGPYAITSYVPGKSLVMRRNPAWHQAADPLRHQYAAGITVTIGVTSPQAQIAGLKAGTWDVMDNGFSLPGEFTGVSNSPDFHIWPGGALLSYLVFNLQSPNHGRATSRADLRRAIEYGINKAAVSRLLGGPGIAPVLNSAIPAGNLGHLTRNPYPAPGDRGDPARCRALLAKAGLHHGITLSYLVADDPLDFQVLHAITTALSRCGITITRHVVPQASYFADLVNAPANNKPGTWDLAQPGWLADWLGNIGRGIIPILFHTNCAFGTTNYGCYTSSRLNALITRAQTAPDLQAATALWLQADRLVMQDAPIVPLFAPSNLNYTSPDVHQAGLAHGVAIQPNLGGPDLTNIWTTRGH